MFHQSFIFLSLFSKPLETVLSAPTTIDITDNLMYFLFVCVWGGSFKCFFSFSIKIHVFLLKIFFRFFFFVLFSLFDLPEQQNPLDVKFFFSSCDKVLSFCRYKFGWFVGWLVGFYGISTFKGYLMPNPFL